MIKNNDKGFTLFEIVTVLAIVAIISAIVVPNLFEASKRSKLKGDIQTVHTVQNAIDLYRVENAQPPTATGTTENDNAKSVMKILYDNGYTKSGAAEPQTENALWTFDKTTSTIGLDITSSNFDMAYIDSTLSDIDKIAVKYVAPAAGVVK